MGTSGVDRAPSPDLARNVLDSLLEACQVIGFDWRYLYLNDAACAQGRRKREDLLGRTMMECYPGIDQTPMFDRLRRCMTERTHERMLNEFTYPDGSAGFFELRFIPVPEGVCVLSLDLTEVKRTEAALSESKEQLREAQKMEAIGRLAGGVAHDFNNLLSVILSCSSFCVDQLPPSHPSRADMEEIQKAGQRAASLTRQLLAFSRQQVIEPEVFDLNESIGSVGKMIRRLVGEHIEVRTVQGASVAKVMVGPGHIEQTLINLVVNARDAMPAGGTLTIETQQVELDAEYAAEHLGVEPGPFVMLAVSDTGEGMDEETRWRIFEPFFTTKDRTKGTGLGLSTVFGIVRQNGGSICVYSELGRGTTFKVYLPRTEVTALQARPPAPAASAGPSRTVLLVEDEEQVRTVARTILDRHGYEVLEARDGGEAMRLCESHEGPIHLLLTDMVMPHMSGPQLAERLAPVRPDMRVLYMSGYTEDAIATHRVLSPATALLQKPLTPDSLLRKVADLVHTTPSEASPVGV